MCSENNECECHRLRERGESFIDLCNFCEDKLIIEEQENLKEEHNIEEKEKIIYIRNQVRVMAKDLVGTAFELEQWEIEESNLSEILAIYNELLWITSK